MPSKRLRKSDLLLTDNDRKVLVESSHVFKTRHELAYLRMRYTTARYTRAFKAYLTLIVEDGRGWGPGVDAKEVKRYARAMLKWIDKERSRIDKAERLPGAGRRATQKVDSGGEEAPAPG